MFLNCIRRVILITNLGEWANLHLFLSYS